VRKFNSIEVPKKLQAILPFTSKPKDRPKSKKPTTDRIPVIMDTDEKKRNAAIQQLKQIKHEKVTCYVHISIFYLQL
jgi:ribosome biogenesis protein BMS1